MSFAKARGPPPLCGVQLPERTDRPAPTTQAIVAGTARSSATPWRGTGTAARHGAVRPHVTSLGLCRPARIRPEPLGRIADAPARRVAQARISAESPRREVAQPRPAPVPGPPTGTAPVAQARPADAWPESGPGWARLSRPARSAPRSLWPARPLSKKGSGGALAERAIRSGRRPVAAAWRTGLGTGCHGRRRPVGVVPGPKCIRIGRALGPKRHPTSRRAESESGKL